MSLRNVVLLSFILGTLHVQAADSTLSTALSCENPVIKNYIKVPHLPPYREQDGLGFCYAMAATVAIEQKNCRMNKISCTNDIKKITGKKIHELSLTEMKQWMNKLPDQRISVLDVMAQGHVDGIDEGGDPVAVLEKLSGGAKLAKESCAPFDGLLYKDFEIIKMKKEWTWWADYKKLYDTYQSLPASLKEEGSYRCATQMHEIFPATENIDNLRQALEQKTFGEFMNRVMIPESCKASAVQIPKFKVRVGTADPIDLQVDTQLKKGVPVIARHCSKISKNNFFATAKNCGPHVNVIVGSRTLCCGDICEKQYQLRDSAYPRYEKRCMESKQACPMDDDTHNGWEAASEFRRKQKKWETEVQKSEKAFISSLVWIE